MRKSNGAKKASTEGQGTWKTRPDLPIDGERMRARRLELSLTQGAFGQRLGVPFNTIARWERGEMGIDHPDWRAHQLDALEQGKPEALTPQIDSQTLRERREALELTQAELGTILRVAPETVRRWENSQMKIKDPLWLSWKLTELEKAAALKAPDRPTSDIFSRYKTTEKKRVSAPRVTIAVDVTADMTPGEALRVSDFLRRLLLSATAP